MAISQESLRSELASRDTLTTRVLRLFLSRPGAWIDVYELAGVGGFAGWRTRVSQARHIIERAGLGQIEWNGKARESAYRFVQMVPVQPDAAQQELFA